jgi:hypothetical protein
MQVSLAIKMVVCQNRGSSVKGNVSESIRHHSYGLYFKIVVTKYIEQTTNCEAARKHNLLKQIFKGENK